MMTNHVPLASTRPCGPSNEANAAPTTTLGRTNGTMAAVRSAKRPGNRNRARTQATGTPIPTVTAHETAACSTVTPTTRQMRALPRIRPSASEFQAPSTQTARSRTAATGTAIMTRTRPTASPDAARADRPRLGPGRFTPSRFTPSRFTPSRFTPSGIATAPARPGGAIRSSRGRSSSGSRRGPPISGTPPEAVSTTPPGRRSWTAAVLPATAHRA